MTGALERLVDRLAARPRVFDMLRWILEAGYRGEAGVIRQEGLREVPRLLDLGCGTGALAGWFPPERYVGVDPSPVYVAHARRKHPAHRFVVMDGRHLALASASFDRVVIAGVIHHLDDTAATALLAEVRRVLRPGEGTLVLWEDVPTRTALNVIGTMIHRLDQGDRIRPDRQYVELVGSVLRVTRHYPMASGVCDYVVVVARAD